MSNVAVGWIGPRAGATRAVLGLAMAAHLLLLIGIDLANSPTNDEVAHLPAGIRIWQSGRFDLYNVNPPLVKLLASLPVVALGPATDWHRDSWLSRPEFIVGLDFIDANGAWWFRYYLVARLACVPLSLLGCWVCYRWAGELYGQGAALLATLLWCSCPNILANGSMITPDLGATSLGLLACYLFWRWISAPTWPRAAASGLALGLADLSKTTWVILWVLWPALTLITAVTRRVPVRTLSSWMTQVAACLSVSVYVVNLGYAFEGSFQPLGSYAFRSDSLAGTRAGRDPYGFGNRFAHTPLAALPVPLPHNYLLGVDVQKCDFDEGKLSYLRGAYSRQGWWYYYLYALLVKVPLGSWGLLALAGGSRLWCDRRGRWLDQACLVLPAVAVLVVVSAHSGINRHLRYALPIFPFAFIWTSRVARGLGNRPAWFKGAGVACLGWSIASSLSAYPHSLAFFNELAGGPEGGHNHLLESNIDWGQDKFALRHWLTDHPEARPLYMDCIGIVGPDRFGIDCSPVPSPHLPGWYALSVGRLHDPSGKYDDFLARKPDAMAGYSIYIYQLDPEAIQHGLAADRH